MQSWQPHDMHEFAPYPPGHAVTKSCVKCGHPKKHGIHRRAGRRRVSINWRRILSKRRQSQWNVYTPKRRKQL